MNYSLVKSLILKDWYFQRRAILLCLAGGIASIAIIAFAGKVGFYIGLIFLITIMIVIGATLVNATLVGERENHTLAFVMSLPISFREYTAAKILVNLLIFLPFWLILVAGCVALILVAPIIHGLLAFTVIMAVEILVNTCLMIAIGLVTESKGWTTSAMIVGNVGFNVIGYIVAHIPGISDGMFGTTMFWRPAATISVLVEFALIALTLGGAFLIQSRKKDFI